jgi:uncharacterized protein (TIGR03083 family)
MMSIQDMVKLIHAESERLKHYVTTLPRDALARPSPCEGWTVGDVVAHLIWFAETYGGMMARGLRGDLSPTDGFPTPGTLSGPAIEELYCQGALTRRQELGASLLPTFARTYEQLNDMLNRIGPEDWEKPCYHTRRLRPVHSFLPTIIQELAVHEWDIRSSLEPSPSLSVASIPVLMEKLPTNRRPWTMPFPSRPTSSDPVRYRFDLTGVHADRRDIIVEGQKTRMEIPGETPANLDVRGDTGIFILLMYGRLYLDSLIATGSFKAEGDVLVPDFDRWLEAH